MLINLLRIIFGYKWEWEEYHRHEFTNGTQILFICKKTGRMKQVFVG